MWLTFVGSWFSFLVQCICLTVLHDLQLPGRLEDVLHPDSKQQTTPAAPRDALECVAALARTREDRQNCVRLAYL